MKIAVPAPAWLALLLSSAALAQSLSLSAQDAWIRATPGSDVAAVYMTLRNVSTKAVTVTAVQSPIANHAMIHETSAQGGQSRMRAHEQLVIPTGQSVKLEPGGLHIMLHGLTRPLTAGESVPVLLTIGGADTLRVNARVRPLGTE